MVCVIVEKTAKPKSSALLWPTEYSFILPYDIDACINQLNTLKDKYRHTVTYLEGKAFNFESLSDNGGVVNFEITAHATRQVLKITSIGQFIHTDHNQTSVKLQIGITRKFVIQDIILSFVIYIVLMTILMGLSGFAIMLSVAIVILFRT